MTMLASPDDLKPGFFERTDGAQVRDPGSLGVRCAGICTSLRFCGLASCLATDRYSRIPSWMFGKASSSVAPCDQQPGRPGQETLYPSSVRTKATGYLMVWL